MRLLPMTAVLFSILLSAGNSYCLTAEEVLLLKENGVSDETIQLMIKSELEAKKRLEKTPYNTMGIREIKRPDGKSSIIYATGETISDSLTQEERLKEEKAWEMLKSLIIDTRVRD